MKVFIQDRGCWYNKQVVVVVAYEPIWKCCLRSKLTFLFLYNLFSWGGLVVILKPLVMPVQHEFEEKYKQRSHPH